MKILFNLKRLENLLLNFHIITGIRTGIYDVDRNEIVAFPAERSNFCRLIRTSTKGEELCKQCDYKAFSHVKKYHELHTYYCHAGLKEAIAPIVAHGDVLGYLMIGQVREENSDKTSLNTVKNNTAHLRLDETLLKTSYNQLGISTNEEILASANILQACASYTWLDDYIRVQKEPIAVQAKRYILNNLSQPLSLQDIAGALNIGKTNLCNNVKEFHNLTVVELIRQLRIQRAKDLLQIGDLPIASIAESVGIPDYNYFAKLFKLEVGVSPSNFKKMCDAEAKMLIV